MKKGIVLLHWCLEELCDRCSITKSTFNKNGCLGRYNKQCKFLLSGKNKRSYFSPEVSQVGILEHNLLYEQQ